jgi:predicted GIY-YIG superfamily endonuclease
MWYIYVMCNSDNQCFHTGVCLDVEKCVAFYNSIICIKKEFKLNRLVYLEGYEEKENAQARFMELVSVPTAQLVEIVKAVNHELTEYIIGENIEL